MKLKHGYDYGDSFQSCYKIVEDEGEAEIVTEVDNVKHEAGRSSGYGTTINLKDGEIVSFTIKAYTIEVTIPATSEAHSAIYKALAELGE